MSGKHTASRRDFLKEFAATTAGLSLAGSLSIHARPTRPAPTC